MHSTDSQSKDHTILTSQTTQELNSHVNNPTQLETLDDQNVKAQLTQLKQANFRAKAGSEDAYIEINMNSQYKTKCTISPGYINNLFTQTKLYPLPDLAQQIQICALLCQDINQAYHQAKTTTYTAAEKILQQLSKTLNADKLENATTTLRSEFEALKRQIFTGTAGHPPGININMNSQYEAQASIALEYLIHLYTEAQLEPLPDYNQQIKIRDTLCDALDQAYYEARTKAHGQSMKVFDSLIKTIQNSTSLEQHD